jgi:hypothetical protein
MRTPSKRRDITAFQRRKASRRPPPFDTGECEIGSVWHERIRMQRKPLGFEARHCRLCAEGSREAQSMEKIKLRWRCLDENSQLRRDEGHKTTAIVLAGPEGRSDEGH